MSGRCIPESAWRRSYDIDDPRAQVSAIYWQVSERNEHAFRFFDAAKRSGSFRIMSVGQESRCRSVPMQCKCSRR
jgi:hypothetical protein